MSKGLKEVRERATCVSEEGAFQIKALIKGEFYKLGLGLVEAFVRVEEQGQEVREHCQGGKLRVCGQRGPKDDLPESCRACGSLRWSCTLGGPGIIRTPSELHAASQTQAGPPWNHCDPKCEHSFPPFRTILLHEPAFNT